MLRHTASMALCFWLFGLLGGLIGCDVPPSELGWEITFACTDAARDVLKVRVEIRKGDCDGTSLYSEVTSRSGEVMKSPAPTLAKGDYGLHVEAVGARDQPLALLEACESISLPIKTRPLIVLGSELCDSPRDSGTATDAEVPGDNDGGMSDAGSSMMDSSVPSPNDRDGDQIANEVDLDPDNNLTCADADMDGCDDCQVLGRADVKNDGPDTAMDGTCDCVFFADPAAKDDSGDGKWWRRAFKSLQRAVDEAKSAVDDPNLPHTTCDVWAKKGTYYILEAYRTDSLTMRKGVSIWGGFAGTELTSNDRDLQKNVSILSGRASEFGVDRVYHVVDAEDDALLDGFTIRDGKADGSANLGRGGGVYVNGKNPTLRNLIFTGNSAEEGGALYVDGADPGVSDCQFRSNTATTHGGAIYAVHSTMIVRRSTFASNSAPQGGALTFDGSSKALVFNSVFWSNAATSHGGGTYDTGSAETSYWNCSFVDNTAAMNGPDAAVSGLAKQHFYSSILQGTDALVPRWYRVASNGTIDLTHCVSSYFQLGGMGVTIVNAVSGQATFVNRALGDLHLTVGSPGINASYQHPTTPMVDIEGTAAVGIRDVGAYEYVP